MINNFIGMGVDPNCIDIVCAKQEGTLLKEWTTLAANYPARFFFYDDTREKKEYVSSIRPNILKQHWKAHPNLKDQAIFYHDNDIIFTKPISTWISPKIINDENWYGSDTISYIGYNYIKSKGEDVLNKMCSLMQLPTELIEANAINSIGAQYLMKNVTYEYWDRVEKDSELLFKEVTKFNKLVCSREETKYKIDKLAWEAEHPGSIYSVPPYNSLQIWCADMWSVLWGAWRLGHSTTCLPEFNFSWAPYDLEHYSKCNILHNAGVVNSKEGLFYKSDYTRKLPYKEQIDVKPNTASKKYWDLVVEVGKRSCLIDNDLEIIKLTYGNKDFTDTIPKNSLGPITLLASNSVYGDPLPDIVKKLQVVYRTKKGICDKTILEGESITISNSDISTGPTTPLASYIQKDINNIFFFWEGYIRGNRLKLLQDCVYSTRILNVDRPIYIISNTLDQSIFEDKYNVKVVKWDYSFFDECGIPIDFLIKNYFNTSPRELADLMRLVALHKFGGSYVDTDDIAIKPMATTKNTICRSYDPHTSFYNHILPEQCVPGKYREISGYDHLNMFPRNDCWQNFEPGHYLIYELLNNPKVQNAGKAVYITDDFSWQSLINEIVVKYQHKIGIDFNYKLTLLYLYEDFIAGSSLYDLGKMGGELHDIYNQLPNISDYSWGNYKCTAEVGLSFYNTIISKYPNVSHMWMHSKEAKTEWFEGLDLTKNYSLTTWIYNIIKEKIKNYSVQQYSVVIPTLWYSPRIYKLLEDLEKCNEVGEIILIDNNNLFSTKNIINSKLRVISTNENSFVNPAWNLGVEYAKYNYIALCNDDINFSTDIFKSITPKLLNFNIIGQATENYYIMASSTMDVIPIKERPSGWGCLLFFKKENWIPIPSYLKIACGDDFLLDNSNKVGALTKFAIATEISTTSFRKEFDSIQALDIDQYEKSKVSNIDISVLTLTYQRHEILEEAIQSFLSQDFKGNSEMVIINDSQDVKYYINDPRIRIINCSERFSSIGKKLEFGYKQCKYSNIYRLDDDDLLTPNALNISASIILNNPGFDIYRTEKYYYFLNNIFVESVANTNTGNIFTKNYLDRITFPDKSIGEDRDMLDNFNAKIKTVNNKGCTMIYRWGNQVYHISAMDNSKVNQMTDNLINIKEQGIITLHPQFRNDYYNQLPK